MKYILSIAIIILSIITIQAQTIKNYSGPYKDKVVYQFPSSYAVSDIGTGFKYGGISGNANYEYFENSNLERIFQGKFTLTTSGTYSTSISGSYKNNLKDGYWKYNLNRRDQDNTNFSPCTEIAEGNYNQGKLNGNWTYNLIDKKTGKKYYSSKAQFSNNIMIGSFEFTANNLDKFEFKINYDSLGDLNGNYNVKYWVREIPFEDIRVYKHGKLISSIHRNMGTGDLLNSNEYKYENGNFWELYTALSFWGCNDNGYNGCERGDNPIFFLAKGTDLKVINNAKEEKVKKENELNNASILKKLNVSGDSCQSIDNMEGAIKFYSSAINFCKNQTIPVPDDLTNKIKSCETIIAKKQLAAKENKVLNLIAEADKFEATNDYSNAVSNLKQASEILPNKDYTERIKNLNQKIFQIESERKKGEQQLKQNKFESALNVADSIAKKGELDNALNQLNVAQSLSTAYIAHLDQQIVGRKDNYDYLVKFVIKTKSNHQTISNSDLSTSKSEIFNIYNEIYAIEISKKIQYYEYARNLFKLSQIQENIIKSIIPEKKLKKFTKRLIEEKDIEQRKKLISNYPKDLNGELY